MATDLGASFIAEKDEEGVEPQDRANVRGGLAGARAEEQYVRIASNDFPFDPRGRGNRRLGPGAAAILGWGSSDNCSTWADDYRGGLGREGEPRNHRQIGTRSSVRTQPDWPASKRRCLQPRND